MDAADRCALLKSDPNGPLATSTIAWVDKCIQRGAIIRVAPLLSLFKRTGVLQVTALHLSAWLTLTSDLSYSGESFNFHTEVLDTVMEF